MTYWEWYNWWISLWLPYARSPPEYGGNVIAVNFRLRKRA